MIFLSKVWTVLLLITIVFGLINGSCDIITQSIMENSKKAVENIISIIGMLCFWSGIFKIFEETTVVEKISDKMSKVIVKLFDKRYLSKEAEKYISLNIVSNILGIGNASTVNGIKAMKELAKYSKEGISNSTMNKFVVINTASLQIFPTSMISLRTLYGSRDPAAILIPVILISAVTLVLGLFMINFLDKVVKEE